MRVGVASVVLAMALAGVWAAAVPAAAGPTGAGSTGIELSWVDCPASPSAVSDRSAICGDGTPQTLVCSFTLASPVDSVLALEAVVDVVTASGTLPDWWQFAPSGCDYGGLRTDADFGGFSACTDLWQGQATFGGPPVYSVGQPHGGANQAGIQISFAVLSNIPRTLSAGTHYYAARLVFRNDSATCTGCTVPACLVLNAIRLDRPGTVAGDVALVNAVPDANRVTWQGPGAPCDAVPVRRTTWGQLHSLYR